MAKPLSCMSRARMKLEPGERLLLAARPHPAVLIPALLRALGVADRRRRRARAAAALLGAARRPHRARPPRDRVRGRSVFRFARAVWQWDRSLLALTTRRVVVVAPRGRLRRAWETMPLGRDPLHRRPATASPGACSATGRSPSATARAAATSASSATPSASPRRSSTRARTAAAPGRRSRGRLSLSSRPLVRASHDRGRDQAG